MSKKQKAQPQMPPSDSAMTDGILIASALCQGFRTPLDSRYFSKLAVSIARQIDTGDMKPELVLPGRQAQAPKP